MKSSFQVSAFNFQICKKRMSVADFAAKACANFSKLLPELDPKGSGLQAPHENCKSQNLIFLNGTAGLLNIPVPVLLLSVAVPEPLFSHSLHIPDFVFSY
jgi:hypothetical protein